jgi:bisphosphoglycerate-dependent phosphoglycerate mutase
MTAVEWLKEKISDMTIHKTHLNDTISEWQEGYNVALEDVNKLFNKALEMEKQQIIDAFNEDLYGGLSSKMKFETGEQYYNETYKPSA